MPRLVIHSGTSQLSEFELKTGTNSIGRDADNDFAIDDPSVSSFHARIIVEGEKVLIEDLGSTNGTFILHSQVKEGVIQPGQFIRLGNVFLIFQADSPTARVMPTATVAFTPPTAAPKVVPVRATGSTPPPVSVPPPPPAPVTAPAIKPMAPAVELAEPPAGKTTCKFHPKTGGEWLCGKCNELFCSVCVITRQTGEDTGHFCRKCGTACVPVRVKYVALREKPAKRHSSKAILLRTLGFGFIGALVSALVWTGLSWLFNFDVPFIFCSLSAVICGYAVRLGSLESPGALFSSIAVVCCLIGSVLGKAGMVIVTQLTLVTDTYLFTSALGLPLCIFVAWKIGGSDS